MNSLCQYLNDFNNDLNYVLAVIIKTDGSTYRKTGALMLIDQHLNYWGLLSGGCLENDIVMQSKNVFNHKKDQIIQYNMRDENDLLWGMGLGCDGEITILLKYLSKKLQHLGFFDALRSLYNGNGQTLCIERKNNPQINFIEKDEEQCSSADRKNQLVITMEPPHHLLICGAAPDVLPVTAIAHQVGWKISVIDHRQDYASSELFPLADRVVHVKRSSWKNFDLSPFDSAVIMSHQFERDRVYFSRLLHSAITYIGLLGPAKRRDRILEQCNTRFSKLQGRVFAPVGLDIGSESPEMIALAIISEIQSVINGKQKHDRIGFCYQDKTR